MDQEHEPPDIVSQAFYLSAAVDQFVERARTFYYAVMLSGHECPECGGILTMLREALCRCQDGCPNDPNKTEPGGGCPPGSEG